MSTVGSVDFGLGVELSRDCEDSLLDCLELVFEDAGGEFGDFSVF